MGFAAALVAAVIVGALIGTKLSSQPTRESRVDHEVSALLGDIPQEGNTLGRPTAPVTLQVFADLECLTVKNWVVRLLPAIIRGYVRSGVVKIQYLSFKTDTRDPRVFANQQTAALAAGEQNKMWNFIETFYYEQGREYTPYATESYLDGIASQVPGLDLARWHRDRGNVRLAERPGADDHAGRAVGFYDTPSFRIGRTGGTMKNFSGRTVIMMFAGFSRLRHPLSLIDTQDLEKAVKGLVKS
jgi:hypothetical protein